MKQHGYPFRNESAKLVEVIEVHSCWGDGTEGDPNRNVTLYFSKEGYLLAVNDIQHPHERMLHDRSTGM